MLRKRSSRMNIFSSTPAKRQPAPAPKPGRTLILSSTSSSYDLGHIVEEGFEFDFEKSNHFDHLSDAEPLFNDFFLTATPAEPPSPPPIPEELPWGIRPDEHTWATTPSKAPSLRWSMDTDVNEDSDDDAVLDSLCSTPPEGIFMARHITIVYSGKPRMVDLPRSILSDARPVLNPLQSQNHSRGGSRTSSVSTRDSPLSPSSRFSDGDDKSSPASSISEYSNLVYSTIPEESSFQAQLPDDARLKPAKRSHRRNTSSSASNFYLDDMRDFDAKIWEIQPLPTPTSHLEKPFARLPRIPTRTSSSTSEYSNVG